MLKRIKTQKGVTLAALTVYLTVFIMIIGIVTTISTHFYSGIGEVVDAPKYLSEFNLLIHLSYEIIPVTEY